MNEKKKEFLWDKVLVSWNISWHFSLSGKLKRSIWTLSSSALKSLIWIRTQTNAVLKIKTKNFTKVEFNLQVAGFNFIQPSVYKDSEFYKFVQKLQKHCVVNIGIEIIYFRCFNLVCQKLKPPL